MEQGGEQRSELQFALGVGVRGDGAEGREHDGAVQPEGAVEHDGGGVEYWEGSVERGGVVVGVCCAVQE